MVREITEEMEMNERGEGRSGVSDAFFRFYTLYDEYPT